MLDKTPCVEVKKISFILLFCLDNQHNFTYLPRKFSLWRCPISNRRKRCQSVCPWNEQCRPLVSKMWSLFLIFKKVFCIQIKSQFRLVQLLLSQNENASKNWLWFFLEIVFGNGVTALLLKITVIFYEGLQKYIYSEKVQKLQP